MISIFGSSLIFLAFLFAIISFSLLLFGRIFRKKNKRYIASGSNALLSSCLIIIICFIALLSQFLSDSFDLKFVTETSSISTPLIYKIGALWAGATGSLLLWSTIVSIYIIYFILLGKKRYSEIFSTSLMIMGLIYACFLGFIFFLQNPFEPIFNQFDGQGTGANLQHILMLIHPPMLYLGYIGFLIPFSTTIASLIENKNDINYVNSNRRHVLFAWLILTVAIILGGRWAYLELGWGGYWAWDPVENASLMPWLISTAYLHSILVEQKKGMLRLWNVILISTTYCLTILGVYLVRGGLIKESVHSFAESEIGTCFLILFFVLLCFSTLTIIFKAKSLKPQEKIESFTSRESGFLYNNVLFVGLMVFILFAIFQPIFSSIFSGQTIKLVDQNGYNKIAALFGVFLLFLMGVAPFLAWRKTSRETLKKIFFLPMLISLGSFLISFLILLSLNELSWMSLIISIYIMLIVFVAYGIFDEFIRATYLRYKNKNENLLLAFLRLFSINQSRYGGYIVHIGFLIMTIGFIGRAFETKNDYYINSKDSTEINSYTFSIDDHYIETSSKIPNAFLMNYLTFTNFGQDIPTLMKLKNPIVLNNFNNFTDKVNAAKKNNESKTNHFSEIIVLNIEEDNTTISLPVEKRFYYSNNPDRYTITKEIALDSNLIKDLYIILNKIDYNTGVVHITVWINYLVNWVWIGTLIILIGGLISLNPFSRYNHRIKDNLENA